ncbi:tRNA pseudouridine(55) synthase TruB [Salaquimonas pukyongi]|uniref:tRNA pseudouridine(55) synthase TruB n=1 Tax=Salaquimonas pukyongi TaxID=2712698 RepID=UPI00096B7D04|nr:tRNA pseudouridine(55) synthase TruB [Salaquimonas pukyongi]
MSRQRQKKGRPVSGWVILDKPLGMGSTQAVAKVKWLYKAAKAGHAGTLDPLATGMLPVALGEATRTVPYVMDGAKTYRFAVTWGMETNTDDLEGTAVETSDLRPDEVTVRRAMGNYTGTILQVPPAYSAIKIGGERAYKLARDGEAVEIEPREVEIHRFELMEVRDCDTAVFEVDCGKGTYVRALARDMGRDLGCYGHVSELRRTAVEPFNEEDLVPLDQLAELEGDLDALDSEILATGIALENLPEVAISKDQATRLRSGNPVILRGRDAIAFAEEVVAVSGSDLVAIGQVEKGSFLPKRVFKVSAA